jgi:hypothetical protein
MEARHGVKRREGTSAICAIVGASTESIPKRAGLDIKLVTVRDCNESTECVDLW